MINSFKGICILMFLLFVYVKLCVVEITFLSLPCHVFIMFLPLGLWWVCTLCPLTFCVNIFFYRKVTIIFLCTLEISLFLYYFFLSRYLYFCFSCLFLKPFKLFSSHSNKVKKSVLVSRLFLLRFMIYGVGTYDGKVKALYMLIKAIWPKSPHVLFHQHQLTTQFTICVDPTNLALHFKWFYPSIFW